MQNFETKFEMPVTFTKNKNFGYKNIFKHIFGIRENH